MKPKKKKLIIITFCIVIILAIAGIVIFLVLHNQKSKNKWEQPPMMNGMGEGVISASGVTSVGMSDEIWDLDFLETSLYVDESYLATGDEVQARTPVFHVSEDTLANARKELENAVTEAKLAYRQGVLEYEVNKLDAKATYDQATVNKKYAQTEYEEAVASAKKTVSDLEKQVEEARKLAEEYQKSVSEDYYRTYYKVDELYQNYYEHFQLLMEYYEKWDIENLKDKVGTTQKVTVYESLDSLVQEEGAAYEEALKSYEDAKATAAAGLDEANSNLANLEAELTQAQTTYQTDLITCKADYQKTLAESDNAQTVYETTLESLEETLNQLEDTKAEAEENLELFEATIGDGYFYTQKAGTVVMNAIRKKSYLSGESIVMAYSDPSTVTISANVDQSDIANISIGDSAYVVISEFGNYQGVVSVINPVTQAESRSSVTYSVTVTLEGDISNLDTNLTAYVYFGMTEDMKPMEKGANDERTLE